MTEIETTLEAIERDAWEDAYAAGRPASDMRVERFAGGTGFLVPGLDNPMINRWCTDGGPVGVDDLEVIAQNYAGIGVSKFYVQLVPSVLEASRDALALRSFAPSRLVSWVKMRRGTEPPPDIATELRVTECDGSPRDREAFAGVVVRGFELPPSIASFGAALCGRPGWRTYLAWAGEEPVAAGATFMKGGVAWLGFGATLPDFRRRGGQGAIMSRRIADAIAAGCTLITTETGRPPEGQKNASLENMRRTGFVEAYERWNFVKR